jgi:transcriptional regulator with XRE-family HTH domain
MRYCKLQPDVAQSIATKRKPSDAARSDTARGVWIVRDVPVDAGWGERVRRLREARNLTAAGLAERAGLAQSQVSRIESGAHVEVRRSTLVALADALGVSLDLLVGREPPAHQTAADRLERIAQELREQAGEQGRDSLSGANYTNHQHRRPGAALGVA